MMPMGKSISVQEWLPIQEIYDKGIVKLKDNSFVKIIKIYPINYNLKSDLEKQAILNSYKIFLKTCNFNIQIIIQSNKENLSQIISKINNQNEKDNKIKIISQKYIEYIKQYNYIQKSAAKNFYIVIKKNNLNKKENIEEELEEKYLKIKENLSRCGNYVEEIKTLEELRNLLELFFNKKI
jgi:type IV secretory pathway VirB4 component